VREYYKYSGPGLCTGPLRARRSLAGGGRGEGGEGRKTSAWTEGERRRGHAGGRGRAVQEQRLKISINGRIVLGDNLTRG